MPQEKPEFDQYAENYDALRLTSVRSSGEDPSYFSEYKIRYLKNFLSRTGERNPASILDFGCGVGNSLPFVVNQFPSSKIIGVDVSGESLTKARQIAPSTSLFPITDSKIPLEDASIDVAFASCVYHHIPPPQRSAWTEEIKRVLRPGGRFFIFEHNPLNPLTLKVVRECPYDEDAILLGKLESQHLLAENEFSDIRTRYIVFFPRFLSFARPIESRIGWLPMGAQYVTSGKK